MYVNLSVKQLTLLTAYSLMTGTVQSSCKSQQSPWDLMKADVVIVQSCKAHLVPSLHIVFDCKADTKACAKRHGYCNHLQAWTCQRSQSPNRID